MNDLRWVSIELPEDFQVTTSGTSGPNQCVVSISGGGRVYDGAHRDLTVADLLRIQQSMNDAVSQAIHYVVAEAETALSK